MFTSSHKWRLVEKTKCKFKNNSLSYYSLSLVKRVAQCFECEGRTGNQIQQPIDNVRKWQKGECGLDEINGGFGKVATCSGNEVCLKKVTYLDPKTLITTRKCSSMLITAARLSIIMEEQNLPF